MKNCEINKGCKRPTYKRLFNFNGGINICEDHYKELQAGENEDFCFTVHEKKVDKEYGFDVSDRKKGYGGKVWRTYDEAFKHILHGKQLYVVQAKWGVHTEGNILKLESPMFRIIKPFNPAKVSYKLTDYFDEQDFFEWNIDKLGANPIFYFNHSRNIMKKAEERGWIAYYIQYYEDDEMKCCWEEFTDEFWRIKREELG